MSETLRPRFLRPLHVLLLPGLLLAASGAFAQAPFSPETTDLRSRLASQQGVIDLIECFRRPSFAVEWLREPRLRGRAELALEIERHGIRGSALVETVGPPTRRRVRIASILLRRHAPP